MGKDVINFSTNWNNKLACKFFTTIRLKNENKYVHNKLYTIHLKNQPIKQAEIIQIKNFTLSQLTEVIASLDTGYCLEDTKSMLNQMYSKKVNVNTHPFSLILLKTVA